MGFLRVLPLLHREEFTPLLPHLPKGIVVKAKEKKGVEANHFTKTINNVKILVCWSSFSFRIFLLDMLH